MATKYLNIEQLIAINNQDPTDDHLKAAQYIMEEIFFHPVNKNGIINILPNTSAGCPFTKEAIVVLGSDGIRQHHHSAHFQKLSCPGTFNTCLKFAKFPDSLKVGNVVLFLKPGKLRDDASSYHFISL
ncbi:hypothetical protein HNY73_010121 [Argiope bruennichi]|uniref:Uncharacterized protein n=1 Tax=Argiope bruennichi TaxID=94029 RepID=A0A8T0F290_ARGBR|nr:hypothetical protein HNY73_010121 [Argiope bruennichi]